MSPEKFIKNRAALITLIAASLVVLLSLGVRQTFGLFFIHFNSSLAISNTEIGLEIGINQYRETTNILKRLGFREVSKEFDFNKNVRCIISTKANIN